MFSIYITRHIRWRTGWAALPKSLPLPGGRGVESCQLQQILNQYIGDTWRPLIGPRVTIPFTANKPRHMPTVHTTACHMSYNPVSYGLPRQHPYGLYGLYSQHPFFLPVCRFEQNAISLSPDVRLNPNELRWVRDDEAYAPVRFEAIPSTLNFEQNLIPWIT
jgi:hypothetical protein